LITVTVPPPPSRDPITKNDGTMSNTWQLWFKAISSKIFQADSSTGTTGKPAASSQYRGTVWITKGEAGVADTVQICLKSAANTYSWVTIATG